MKGTKIFLLVGIIFSGVLLVKWYGTGQPKEISTWVWDTSKEIDLQFAQNHDVSELYYYVNKKMDVAKTAVFIQQANEMGMDVYALQGEPEWTYESGKAIEWLNAIKQYNEQSSYPFAGVVFDIEPYLLEEWETASEDIAHQFLSVVKEIESVQKELPIKWTIPFWFDEIQIEPNQSLAESLFQEGDEIIVMAYRNELFGNDGLLAHIKHESKWANDYKTPLIVAIETKKADEGKISFYGMEQDEFQTTLEKLQKELAQETYIHGISIHYLDTWKELIDEDHRFKTH